MPPAARRSDRIRHLAGAAAITGTVLLGALADPPSVGAASAKGGVKLAPASQTANKAGWELMKQRKWADAVPELEKAVAADARNRTAWNNLGVCQLRLYESGLSATTAVASALAAFTKAEELEPGNAANLGVARSYADQEGAWAAAAAMRTGQPPREPEATGTYATYKAAGDAAEAAGDLALAQANYARAEAVSNSKRSKSAAANFQGYLALRHHDPATAVDHLRRATSLDAGNKFAWNNLGVALRRRWEAGAGGRELLEEAVAAFTKVSELDAQYKADNLSDARALLETLGPPPSATPLTDAAASSTVPVAARPAAAASGTNPTAPAR